MCHPLVAKDKEETPPIFVMTVHDYPNFYFGQWNGWKAYFNQRTNNTFWTLRHFHRDMEGIDLEAPLLLRFSAIYISYIYIHISSMLQPDVPKTPANLHRFQAIGNGMWLTTTHSENGTNSVSGSWLKFMDVCWSCSLISAKSGAFEDTQKRIWMSP